MIRNLKVLGLALVAVLAMSAVAASGASATGNVTSTDGTYPLTLKGEQVGANVLSIAGGVRTVSCSEAELNSTLGAASTTVTATAKYGGCTGNGETTATVNMTSCDYTLSGATVSGTTGTGHVTIDCSAGDAIHVEIWEKTKEHTTANMLCGYTITAGKLGGTFTWHNETVGTATEDITLTLTGLTVPEAQLHVTHSKSAILCGKAVGGKTTATYSGNVTVKGFSGATQKKVMIG